MNIEKLHILMLEDDSLDAELNQEQLLLLNEYNCIVKVVEDKEEYIKVIETRPPPDLILCDYSLPQYNGMEALKDLNARELLIPFVFVTGATQEEIAADAIKAGAWDYVVKDRLYRLPLAIRNALKLKKEKEISFEIEKKSQRLLKAIEETSAQIIVLDSNTNIEYVNRNFTIVTGYSSEEVIGKPIDNFFSKNTWEDKNIQDILEKGNFKGDIYNYKKNGEKYWEHLLITPVLKSKDKILNYIIIKEDITQKKKIEHELLEAYHKAEQSNKLKEIFLENISHEIRTPLNAIVGFSRLLKDQALNDTKIIEPYTEIINDSSNQLLTIVDDILTAASIQTGNTPNEISFFNLHDLFEQLYEIFLPYATEKKLKLNYQKTEKNKDFIIQTDKAKLTQIITNLLNNAIKYTHKGHINFKYELAGDMIRFSVTDTGIGIADKDKEIIFDRFRQASPEIHANYGGSGLGLSISKSFAEMLGGTIHVKSKLNHGSEFTLLLPNSLKKEMTHDLQKTKTICSNQPLKIIIAEDDEANFFLLELILANINIKILHAANGQQVIELYNKHPDTDLILMDLKMPLMDGIEAIKKIREKNTKIPIIAQTAYVTEDEKQKAFHAGCNDYITKPIKEKKLIEKICSLLKMKQA
jgi:PAS domain S-box-containing protein